MRSESHRTLKIGGFTPFSSSDYPGQLAAVVFVQGCPWNCRYCHNPQLRDRGVSEPHAWAQIMAMLKRRAGLLDAVVFSGGEPTLDPALASAIAAVKQLGFKVGLHTACIYPKRLAEVLPMLDWVGFDIKAPFENYAAITGVAGSGEQARLCAQLIIDSGVAHECRTTVHPALLPPAQLTALAETLAGLGVRNYVLQEFRALGCADAALKAGAQAGYPQQALVDLIAPRFERFAMRRGGG